MCPQNVRGIPSQTQVQPNAVDYDDQDLVIQSLTFIGLFLVNHPPSFFFISLSVLVVVKFGSNAMADPLERE